MDLVSGVDSSSGRKLYRLSSSASESSSVCCCDWATCSKLGCLGLFLKAEWPIVKDGTLGVACNFDCDCA